MLGYDLYSWLSNLDDIRKDLIKEFRKPKLEKSCVLNMKKRKHKVGETIWDYDQSFNELIGNLTFKLLKVQHMEWAARY